jgi:hypothetical protein
MQPRDHAEADRTAGGILEAADEQTSGSVAAAARGVASAAGLLDQSGG